VLVDAKQRTDNKVCLSLSLSQSNIAYMLIIYLEVTVRVLGNIWMSSAERVKRL